MQVVGFFDVAARLCAGDGPIAALVGVSSCSIGSALPLRTFNEYSGGSAVMVINGRVLFTAHTAVTAHSRDRTGHRSVVVIVISAPVSLCPGTMSVIVAR